MKLILLCYWSRHIIIVSFLVTLMETILGVSIKQCTWSNVGLLCYSQLMSRLCFVSQPFTLDVSMHIIGWMYNVFYYFPFLYLSKSKLNGFVFKLQLDWNFTVFTLSLFEWYCFEWSLCLMCKKYRNSKHTTMLKDLWI